MFTETRIPLGRSVVVHIAKNKKKYYCGNHGVYLDFLDIDEHFKLHHAKQC